MAVKQRIIKARISGNVNLRHGDHVKYYVYSDTGAPSRSEVLGTSLNYDIYGPGGYEDTGLSYSKVNLTGCNGGTTRKCWFNLYFDQDYSYQAATVGLEGGINNASIDGTSFNIDPNDSPQDTFEALFAPTPSYISLQFMREDESTSTNGVNLRSSSELVLYLGYNVREITLSNPGAPSITENWNGTLMFHGARLLVRMALVT